MLKLKKLLSQIINYLTLLLKKSYDKTYFRRNKEKSNT